MKKRIRIFIFFILTIFIGLMLSVCEKLESGIGTIQVINNSSVDISYWSLEGYNGNTIWETRSVINPGASASHLIDSGNYWVYLEDMDGDGWLTKTSHTVKKDGTTMVKFPGDFIISN